MEGVAHQLVQMTAIAIAAGILAQVIAQRARLPSIVLLLVMGILPGPDERFRARFVPAEGALSGSSA